MNYDKNNFEETEIFYQLTFYRKHTIEDTNLKRIKESFKEFKNQIDVKDITITKITQTTKTKLNNIKSTHSIL
jgi:archaellum component FlaC